MPFTDRDLCDVKSRAAGNYSRIPPRCRLPGMLVDLTEGDLRVLAIYEAALVHAYRKLGGIDPGPDELKELFPAIFTEVHQTVEADVTSYNQTEQKK